MEQYKIQHLHKYRKINDVPIDWTKNIFAKRELYFASRNQFNDPFDCRSSFEFEGTPAEQDSYFRNVVAARAINWSPTKIRNEASKLRLKARTDPYFKEKVERGIFNSMNKIGIFSLSEVNDDILMWSHYSDSHKGYCLEFIDDNTHFFVSRAQKVIYRKELPVVNPLRDKETERLEKTVLTKAKNWSYEKEWRLLDFEKGPGIQVFPTRLLKGVIFGALMPGEEKQKIKEYCKIGHLDVQFYQSVLSNRSYSLEVTKCI